MRLCPSSLALAFKDMRNAIQMALNHGRRQGEAGGHDPPEFSLTNLPNLKNFPVLAVNTGSILFGPPRKNFLPTPIVDMASFSGKIKKIAQRRGGFALDPRL